MLSIKKIKKRIFTYTLFLLFSVIILFTVFFIYKEKSIIFSDINNIYWNIFSKNKYINILSFPLSHNDDKIVSEDIDMLKSIDLFDIDIFRKLNKHLLNLSLLNSSFDYARKYNSFINWEYYYDLWNIDLIEWYSYLLSWKENESNDDLFNSFNLLSNAIINYNNSARLLWDINNPNAIKIINNRVASYYMRILSSLEICINLFVAIFDWFNDMSLLLDELIDNIYHQIGKIIERKENVNDEYIYNCLLSLENSNKQSYLNLINISNIINGYIDSSVLMFENYVKNDQYSCVIEYENINSTFLGAYSNIYWSLLSYKETFDIIDIILDRKDINALLYLCENADSFSDNISDNNDDLQEWLNSLDELFNNSNQTQNNLEPQHRDPNYEIWEDDLFSPQDRQEDIAPNSNEAYHDILKDWTLDQKRNELREKWNNWIWEMYERRSLDNYSPSDYIYRLFREFYWSPDDFWNRF